jgi:MFS family permease
MQMASCSIGVAEPASRGVPNPTAEVISRWQTALFAIACGLLSANVYISQPVAGSIAASIGLSPAATGIIVTFTQLGFGAGLLLIVPVADLVENRRLVFILTGIAMAGLLGAALSETPQFYFLSALLVGIGSVAVQVLVPYASHMCPEEIRGRVVGNVMSGLMIGVLLARPLASFVTQLASWRMVFYAAAADMLILAIIIRFGLPRRTPVVTISYGALLKSMGHLALRTPVLQEERSINFACSVPSAYSGRPCRCSSSDPPSGYRKAVWLYLHWQAVLGLLPLRLRVAWRTEDGADLPPHLASLQSRRHFS